MSTCPDIELPPINSYCSDAAKPAPVLDLQGETLSNKHRKLQVVSTSTSPAPAKFKALNLSEMLALPPQEWLCDGLIPSKGLSVIYGAPGSSKTFLILDLAFRVALGGGGWFGRKTKGGPVVIVAGEGVHGLAGRCRAYVSERADTDITDIDAALHVVPHPPNLFAGEAAEFTAAISCLAPKLVVIDTLARSSCGCDENSARDMGQVIAAADGIGKKLGCAILLVHHSGKGGGERGSSALRGASDAMFEVRRHDDGTRELVLSGATSKVKDSAESESIFFRLQPSGESCVVAPADAPPEGSNRPSDRPRPRGSNQQMAWALIGQAAREAPVSTEGAPRIAFGDLLTRWQGAVHDVRKREPGELRRALRAMLDAGVLAADCPSGAIGSNSKIWCP